MNPSCSHSKKFHGTTIVSGKGQVVIPASARKSLKLKTGEKLLVIEINDNTVVLAKLEAVDRFADHLKQKLSAINKMKKKIRKTKD